MQSQKLFSLNSALHKGLLTNASLLGMTSSSLRNFSTIRPLVLDRAIFMQEIYPAKLTVPVTSGKHKATYEFTMDNHTTVADFEAKVKQNIKVKDFKLNPLSNSEDNELITLGQLKQGRFQMRVNHNTFQIYPDLRSLTLDPSPPSDATHSKIAHMDSSISIARQIILTSFYASFVTAVKNAADKQGKLSKEQYDEAIQTALQDYIGKIKSDEYLAVAKEALADFKDELVQLEEMKTQIVRRAHKKAGMMLGMGFMGAVSQLLGFGTTIYILYDWNEMEPYTWMFQSFYLMVGSFFYLATRSDWDYTTVYSTLQNRYLRKITQSEGFNMDKLDALKDYVERLEFQINVLERELEQEQAVETHL